MTGSEIIWSALKDLSADRIGHGTSAAADPALLKHFARQALPVEVCVSSNLRTGACIEHAAGDKDHLDANEELAVGRYG